MLNNLKGYIKKLKEFLATTGTKPAKEGEVEDMKIKQIALRTNENIQVLLHALFCSPL